MSKCRETYIDAVAGLMIVWMILLHLQQVTGYDIGYPSILFFFMPWFYYKSGMLYRDASLLEIVNRKGRKLGKPFVIYGLVGQIVLTICMLAEGVTSLKPYLYSPIRSLVISGTLSGNPPLWFLPSLFVSQCAFSWLYNKRVNGYIIAVGGLVMALAFLKINIVFTPNYISSGLYFVFFYGMGKMLREYQKNQWLFVIAVILLIALCLWRYYSDIVDITKRGDSTLDYFQWTAMALCGCFIINYVFKAIVPIFRFPILQYIGRYAIDFYVVHWIVILLTTRLITGDIIGIWDSFTQIVIGTISCVVVIPIFIFCKSYIQSQKRQNNE